MLGGHTVGGRMVGGARYISVAQQQDGCHAALRHLHGCSARCTVGDGRMVGGRTVGA